MKCSLHCHTTLYYHGSRQYCFLYRYFNVICLAHTWLLYCTWYNWTRQGKQDKGQVQWVKKLFQCLAVSEKLSCNKSSRICKTVKIIYVIEGYLSFWISPNTCDVKQNWWADKQNKTVNHWDSFFTLYYFDHINVISTLYDPFCPN